MMAKAEEMDAETKARQLEVLPGAEPEVPVEQVAGMRTWSTMEPRQRMQRLYDKVPKEVLEPILAAQLKQPVAEKALAAATTEHEDLFKNIADDSALSEAQRKTKLDIRVTQLGIMQAAKTALLKAKEETQALKRTPLGLRGYPCGDRHPSWTIQAAAAGLQEGISHLARVLSRRCV
jgi:hypothetical protein